jgi:hypothetical protein
MKLSEIKNALSTLNEVNFELQNGTPVPAHFHVTEVGVITRHFIDCGGVERTEKVANFQLWNAQDIDHRLKPEKLRNIIALSEQKLGLQDYTVEVEYQAETIGRYDVHYNGKSFILLNKHTACLAEDACGIPDAKQKVSLVEIGNSNSCCTPGSGCC